MSLTFQEALNALYDGHTIRRVGEEATYRYDADKGMLYNEKDVAITLSFNSSNNMYRWEVVKPFNVSEWYDPDLNSDLRDVLQRFQQINVARCEDAFFPLHDRPALYYSNCIAEETGEICGDVTDITNQCIVSETEKTKENLKDEIADLMTYAALLASYFDMNLGEILINKFNEVSYKKGSGITI